MLNIGPGHSSALDEVTGCYQPASHVTPSSILPIGTAFDRASAPRSP